MSKKKPSLVFEIEKVIENNMEFQSFAKACKFPEKMNLFLKGSEVQEFLASLRIDTFPGMPLSEEPSEITPFVGKPLKIGDVNIGDLMKIQGELALVSVKKREMKQTIRVAENLLERYSIYRKGSPEIFGPSWDLVSSINGAWIDWLAGGDSRHSAAQILISASNPNQRFGPLTGLLERHGKKIGKAMTKGRFAAEHIGEKSWNDYEGMCRVVNKATETLLLSLKE